MKPDAKQAIARLRAMGKEVALLSGDARAPVLDLAGRLGIDEAHFRLTPQDKMRLVAAWRAQGRKVAFVGDGVNDAPVLAEADIGLAIGTGSDIAKEAGDVVLATSSPMGVVAAIDLSRATMRNITQNLFWAFGYNIALIPVAAGALAVFGGPHLNPMLAAGAMAASSVFVVMNALRLRHAGQAAGAGLS